MMKTFKISMLCLAISTMAFAQGTKKQLQNLSGTYVSQQAEGWGRGTFGTREFSFSDGHWTLRFVLALDPDMKNQVFEFRTHGTYQVLSKSKVTKAYEAVFYEDKKYVTLKTDNPELIQAFGLSECGLKPHVEKDISKDGCALWPSVADCHEDHDLLALDDQGNLYFGVRPADNNMCTADRRPTALLPPVTKN
ncbi:MAG: hypothetical protein AAFX87_03765 [Bacteroidota bacterium]